MASESGDFDVLVAQERLILEATELVERLLVEHKVSRSQLAKRMGRSKARITQMLDGECNLTLATLAAVGHALNVSFHLMAEEVSHG